MGAAMMALVSGLPPAGEVCCWAGTNMAGAAVKTMAASSTSPFCAGQNGRSVVAFFML
jgi:hypothetical protein